MRNTGIKLALTVALAVSTFVATGCKQEPPPPEPIRPIRSLKLVDTSDLAGRRLPGRAKAVLEVDLGFEVSGQLIERPVNVGDQVPAGTLLARLDPREYDNALLRSKAESDRAKAYYDRVATAFKQRAVARQEVDDARARYDQANATVAIRQKDVDDTRIIAPFDGVVSNTLVDNFQNVNAKQPVIRFLDVSRIEMVINIPEDIINVIPYVKHVRVSFDAIPGEEITATIEKVGNEASEATRTFPVTIAMEPFIGDVRIQPGMAGSATSRISDMPERFRKKGIEVPASAIFSPDDEGPKKTYVWIVDEKTSTVHRREVTTGDLTANGGTVVSGVQTGERIATAGVHTLREGQEVRFKRDVPATDPEASGS
jgi:RND family efflux transporter MFP subunit